jgi:hypothetical protein
VLLGFLDCRRRFFHKRDQVCAIWELKRKVSSRSLPWLREVEVGVEVELVVGIGRQTSSNHPLSSRCLISIRYSSPFLSLLRPMATCLEGCLHLLGVLGGLFLHTPLLSLLDRAINGLLLTKVVIKAKVSQLEKGIPRTRVRVTRLLIRRS